MKSKNSTKYTLLQQSSSENSTNSHEQQHLDQELQHDVHFESGEVDSGDDGQQQQQQQQHMTPQLKQGLYNPERSTAYIITLTLVLGAVQLAWSLEFSEATPFLLSLGVSKQVLALIWLAGPLSGSIGQPIVGMLSDHSNAKIGRRKPFVLAGCLATTISLIYLSHSISIIGFATGKEGDELNSTTVPFAAVGIYVLDFSIQVIQATSRALVVDVVPSDQQQLANAWAARMIGSFNILGFFMGTFDLVSLIGLGDTQFKCLSLLISFCMILMTLYCCWKIEERDPTTDLAIILERKQQANELREYGYTSTSNVSLWFSLKIFVLRICHSIGRMPRQIWTVNLGEFCAWIGYFPMLFYTTSYVGELYLHELGYNSIADIPSDLKQGILDEKNFGQFLI
ncbi:unnamed protein product [Ambrosiozyma monospora]|uniref:Unnamed protein product n=1 Tax=Ambrosiozyma monospora TaxID=43982 RepID=A0ACB5SW30_AMBMO|nr:unnamed protein product [Ambrosiozyma monospora]